MSQTPSPQLVKEIGEQGLLKRLLAFCPEGVVGDDAAVLAIPPEQRLVVTSDVLVNNVHFSDRTTSAEDVGWRAAAANLSDLAAMGAAPLGITVGLSLPGETAIAWVEGLYRGLVDCLKQHNTAIVGGDVCRSSVITVAITALGQVKPHQVIQRSTAKPGDAILVTGVHGASRAGLELLLHPEVGQVLTSEERLSLIQAHQRPKPRLDVVPVLQQVVEGVGKQGSEGVEEQSVPSPMPYHAHTPLPHYPISGMDSSDGLADAVLQICRMSGVGARIERDRIPVPSSLKKWVSSGQALEWALYGGEDFELVLCLPLAMAQAIVGMLGAGAAIVGEIICEPQVLLTDAQGKYPDEVLQLSQGFQHF